MKIPTEGTAVIEVSAHVIHRKELDRYVVIHSSERDNKLNWRAAVHIEGRMEWQWCKTKKEAEDWCRSKLPKNYKPIEADDSLPLLNDPRGDFRPWAERTYGKEFVAWVDNNWTTATEREIQVMARAWHAAKGVKL